MDIFQFEFEVDPLPLGQRSRLCLGNGREIKREHVETLLGLEDRGAIYDFLKESV